MTMTPNPYRQYQTMQVETAGPAQLTLMCFDGICRFLIQAREAMECRRYDVQSATIGKAQALLNELLHGLDFERGGQIAHGLGELYRYANRRLTHANIQDDLAALDEARAIVNDLREAWSEAMRTAGAQSAAGGSGDNHPAAPAAAGRAALALSA